jgi:hypothetical protein
MPSSGLIHAAAFALGAVVGGGVVSAVSQKRSVPMSATPTPAPILPVPASGSRPAIVDVGPNGAAEMTSGAGVVPLSSAVLKYGHPGMWCYSCLGLRLLNLTFISIFLLGCCSGPISDPLVRKAYIAAYDRRLRHPAWVRMTVYTLFQSIIDLCLTDILRRLSISHWHPWVNPGWSPPPKISKATGRIAHSPKILPYQLHSDPSYKTTSGVVMIVDTCAYLILGLLLL